MEGGRESEGMGELLLINAIIIHTGFTHINKL